MSRKRVVTGPGPGRESQVPQEGQVVAQAAAAGGEVVAGHETAGAGIKDKRMQLFEVMLPTAADDDLPVGQGVSEKSDDFEAAKGCQVAQARGGGAGYGRQEIDRHGVDP